MPSSPNRERPRRDSKHKPPGLQPSDIANAILDLSNRAEWAKLAIGKLKPAPAGNDAPAARDAAADDHPEHDERPSR